MNYFQEMPMRAVASVTEVDSSEKEVVSELQLKINQLESELKKQQDATEKGGKLIQLMWGHNFNSESLF